MSFLCNDCPRNCDIDRETDLGFCSVKSDIQVAKIIDNFMWEEPCLCFNKGVTAIFFAGCNLKCSFCQNEKISRCSCGKTYTAEEFALLLKELDQKDIDGIDLISPTQFTTKILEAFSIYKPRHKVIWNSNAYEKEENVEKLSRYVDVFLPDFKYHDDHLAVKYSKAPNYNEICIKAISIMNKNKPNVFEGNNMKQGVIVRHLILPDEINDSKKVLEDIKNNFSEVCVSLMSQFLPVGNSDKKRKIKPIEYKILLSHFKKIGLKNGFFQDLESSNEAFVPKF